MTTEVSTAFTNTTEEVNHPTVRLTNMAFIAGFVAVVLLAISFSHETIAAFRDQEQPDPNLQELYLGVSALERMLVSACMLIIVTKPLRRQW